MAHDRESEAYSMPEEYWSLDELTAPAPVAPSQKRYLYTNEATEQPLKENLSRRGSRKSAQHDGRASSDNYDIPDDFANLDELVSPSPVQNPYERHISSQVYLEEQRSQEQDYERDAEQEFGESSHRQAPVDETETKTRTPPTSQASRFATELYVVSYLISFSILGTLARLGLQALTAYPGSPVITSELWANFGGGIIMGFLSEDRKLFRDHRGNENDNTDVEKREDSDDSQEEIRTMVQTDNHGSEDPERGAIEVRKSHNAMKKIIPLYIGLTTGFCGSFTSFSSFIRDVFLQLANQPPAIPLRSGSVSASPRNGGYSFMAVLAVIIFTVCLCLSGLKGGAHLAIALEKVIPSLPKFLTRKIFDRCAVVFAWALWIGAIFMTIWPPDRVSGPAAPSSTSWARETWRGRVLFSLVFAPLGCILRFYASIRLNGLISSFPLGTFIVNIAGTAILGLCWDLQHAPLGVAGGSVGGGLVGCQVLQGVQDGFCGCLTTISTWVLEMMGLKRKHAYIYGGVSVSVGLAFLVVIMGSLVWSSGILAAACS
jgi:fluoride exporter